jgi:S1-C subfamily serine protease
VKDGSSALKTGFVNFDMDHFGVTKPSLKAIAKTPIMPEIEIDLAKVDGQVVKTTFTWLDVVWREPARAEMSAYGVGFETRGVATTEVPDHSQASKYGFRSSDLVIEINGFVIRNRQNLTEYIRTKGNGKLHIISVIRNQGIMKITLIQTLSNIVL